MTFNPHKDMLSGYSPNDGTIEFYGRVNSVLHPEMTALDLGAGRAEWFEDGKCNYKKNLQLLKGKVYKVVAADVAPIVLSNRSCDEAILIDRNTIPVPDNSFDIVIADWVLEHIEDPTSFKREVDRVLKPGGYFFARTPHGASYLSIFARLVPNSLHASVLRRVQPDRKSEDVFPTYYKMNSLRTMNRIFEGYQNYSYIFRPNPAYFFGNVIVYRLQELFHRIMPSFLCGFLYVVLKKKASQ